MPIIALTFDDGPNTVITSQVLDLLEEHGILASFFLIAQNITPESAEVVRRAKASPRASSFRTVSFSRKNSTDISMIQMGDVYSRIAAVERDIMLMAVK